ncbi:MAG TPA: flagellar biosynthetic protein FliR [Polyangia bacterium]|jgi:flagellar biosynthetic protein FliR
MGTQLIAAARPGLDLSAILLVGALAGARVIPLVLLAPFLGGKLVPAPAKIGLAGALALLVYPHVAPRVPELGPLLVLLLFAKELLVGVALGLCVSLVFHAAEAAGRLVDLARGASMSEALVPQSGTRASPTGDLYLQLAVVLFLAGGGHRLVLAALAHSYAVVPVVAFPGAHGLAALAGAFIDLTAGLLTVALGLAAPVLIATVLTDLALGLTNRVAPQLNAYVLGMPAKALVGAAVLLLGLSVVAGELSTAGQSAVRDLGGIIRSLGR